jgi:bifunctional ADP-heptose synthase (sugar kinase/adenylyltransferase)
MTHAEVIEAMSKVCILVIGDAILDEYIFCRSERLCPEAPVPVLIPERIESRKGGAMNVVEQLRALGVHGKGVYGAHPSVKKRYMVGHQMLLRVDEDATTGLDPEGAIEALNKHVLGEDVIHAVILSDYLKGTLTPELCQHVIEFANDNGVPVIVDPKGTDWRKYEGAWYICPNEHEQAARTDDTSFPYRLFKRGAKGLTLQEFGTGHTWHFPARAREVFDVTGAGDTVVAVFAAALVAGREDPERHSRACELANIAAGWVVGQVGTSVCTKEILLELVK